MHAPPSGSKAAPVTRQYFQTADVDELAACLSGWRQHYDQLSSGTFAGEFEEIIFGPVQIFREVMNQAVYESGAPRPGLQNIAVLTELDGEGWFNGQIVHSGAVLFARDEEGYDFRTPRCHELLAATVDSARLANYARQVEHRELGCIGPVKIAPARAAAYRNFLATLFTALRTVPQMLDQKLMQRAMEQALHGAILEVLGQTEEGGHSLPPAPARQMIVEQARACVRAHPEEPLSVADLCIQLDISRRTLQYSFQEVLDLNPVKFLRVMRLNGVRRVLRAASPQNDTVGDVAARWGFWHLSRFAADYREMFGELPSDTLKKGG